MTPERGFRNFLWWILRLVNLSLLFLIAGATGLLLGTYSAVSKVIPQARDLGDIRPGSGCRVFSSEGELLATVQTENREFIPLERIPKRLQEATIAIEDRDFYRHLGVDPRGIVRAAVHDVLAMGARQGASTITQQLARNVYLSQSKTMARKLAEVVLALQLERAYTKSEILELYLNQIYLGEGAYGVQVAAKTYFGKDASQLDLSECAMLAGLPKAPERYSPFEDEDRARERRDLVLGKMRETGYITTEEEQESEAQPLKLVENRKPLGFSGYQVAPYFVSYVVHSLTDQYGPDAIYKGGLSIYTTLNLEMQKAAEEAVHSGLAKARRLGANEMALVAVDVHTGAIKAMVGGSDYKKREYNSAVQGGRPAGSSFKPFVYTAALEQGYTPDSQVVDSPVSYRGAGGKRWAPRNYDGHFMGRMTFKRALALSRNVPAVKVADMVGVGSVIATAERMGIYHPMQAVLPLAIGYCDVSPLEMASAFAVFAAKGMRTEPYGVRRIVDSAGRVVVNHDVKAWRVLNDKVAAQMVEMLTEVVKRGTAARTVGARIQFPAAGKTGTSSDYKDAWFVGFTEDLSAAVWCGNDAFTPTKRMAGSTVPAPVWVDFMNRAQPVMAAALAREREPVVEISSEDQGSTAPPKQRRTPRVQQPAEEPTPQEPADEEPTGGRVTKDICPASGLLRGPNCPPAVQVTYDLDQGDIPPTKICDLHNQPRQAAPSQPVEPPRKPKPAAPAAKRVTLPICAITGKLATPFCPIVKNITFEAGKAPTETCTRHGRRAPGA